MTDFHFIKIWHWRIELNEFGFYSHFWLKGIKFHVSLSHIPKTRHSEQHLHY